MLFQEGQRPKKESSHTYQLYNTLHVINRRSNNDEIEYKVSSDNTCRAQGYNMCLSLSLSLSEHMNAEPGYAPIVRTWLGQNWEKFKWRKKRKPRLGQASDTPEGHVVWQSEEKWRAGTKKQKRDGIFSFFFASFKFPKAYAVRSAACIFLHRLIPIVFWFPALV